MKTKRAPALAGGVRPPSKYAAKLAARRALARLLGEDDLPLPVLAPIASDAAVHYIEVDGHKARVVDIVEVPND